jgi:RNA polymerase sigma-70 factor (ECF subfamily)
LGVDTDVDGSESDLVRRLREGDRRAFLTVYEEMRPRLFGFLLRLARRRDTAEDLLQETFMKLARHAPNLREDTKIAPWLFTVARNAYISHRRWSMLDMSRFFAMGDDVDDAVSLAATPDAQSERAEAMRGLERALGELPTSHREVLLLVCVEGVEQADAAAILGISHDNLRQRLTRARAALSSTMKELGHAEA